jgi:hypothetical protein
LVALVQLELLRAGQHTFPSTDPMARALRSALAPDETIVLFGFTPSLLWKLERATPFHFVDSAIMYASAGRDSAFRRDIVADWRRALERSDVRFFLVERNWGSALLGGMRSEAMVAEQFPEPVLRELGYERTTRFEEFGRWDAYERRHPGMGAASTGRNP